MWPLNIPLLLLIDTEGFHYLALCEQISDINFDYVAKNLARDKSEGAEGGCDSLCASQIYFSDSNGIINFVLPAIAKTNMDIFETISSLSSKKKKKRRSKPLLLLACGTQNGCSLFLVPSP